MTISEEVIKICYWGMLDRNNKIRSIYNAHTALGNLGRNISACKDLSTWHGINTLNDFVTKNERLVLITQEMLDHYVTNYEDVRVRWR